MFLLTPCGYEEKCNICVLNLFKFKIEMSSVTVPQFSASKYGNIIHLSKNDLCRYNLLI